MLLLIVLNPRLALGENALALSIEIDAEATGGAGPMTAMGHGEKNSQRAYFVSIASISGIPRCSRAGLSRANRGHLKVPPAKCASLYASADVDFGHVVGVAGEMHSSRLA